MTEIEFPWPPKELGRNFQRSHHWTKYRNQMKAGEMLGWGLTKQAIGPRYVSPPAGGYRIPVRLQLQPPMRGGVRPDDDNAIGSLKAYLDGIARALGVNDRVFELGKIEWLPKVGAGRVIISF